MVRISKQTKSASIYQPYPPDYAIFLFVLVRRFHLRTKLANWAMAERIPAVPRSRKWPPWPPLAHVEEDGP